MSMVIMKIEVVVRLNGVGDWLTVPMESTSHAMETARAMVDGLVTQGHNAVARIQTMHIENYFGPGEGDEVQDLEYEDLPELELASDAEQGVDEDKERVCEKASQEPS